MDVPPVTASQEHLAASTVSRRAVPSQPEWPVGGGEARLADVRNVGICLKRPISELQDAAKKM